MKVCLVLLCFTLAFAKFEGNHEEFESSLRKLLDGNSDLSVVFDLKLISDFLSIEG